MQHALKTKEARLMLSVPIQSIAAPIRRPECPESEPLEQPGKHSPERPVPSTDPQPLRAPPETPVLPDSHPEDTPIERPD